jgi:Restriction endonuclease NotI
MLISEIFGRNIHDISDEAQGIRKSKTCPFRKSPCTKSSITDPLGVCTLSDGNRATAVCPVRFLEGDLIFKEAGKVAFGPDCTIAVFPEIKILRIGSSKADKFKKIGKMDFLLGKLENGIVTDFAALEVQATYFSGKAIRPAFDDFLENRHLNKNISDRRPDFRSSAQKRLMPQLRLKVPVFRRWGKKFFIVVDSHFFNALPAFKATSPANSEIIWLSFPILLRDEQYVMQAPNVVGTHWDEVVTSLREGQAPEPEEIFAELQTKLDTKSATGLRRLVT